MKIIAVDSREASKHQKLIDKLKEEGLDVVVSYFEYGDYHIPLSSGETVILERKTPFDLMGSVDSGRLWDQILALKTSEKTFPFVLLEGSPTMIKKYSKRSDESVAGVLFSIIWDWKIPIIYAPSEHWTALYLKLFASLNGDKVKQLYPVKFRSKGVTNKDHARAIIEGYPGVSSTIAVSLLKHFGSVKSVVNASESKLEEVEKIGEKKAKTIHSISNYKYSR